MDHHPIEKFVSIIKALRHPETGCPWDLKQTPQSLVPHLIEETYETVEAIETKKPVDIKEELGDLLLQIVLQAQLADEKNEFNFNDIVENVSAKIIRRHPHVFEKSQNLTADEVALNWQKIKQTEKKDVPAQKGILSDISAHQPAHLEILKIQKKISSLGFKFEKIQQVLAKTQEELNELVHEINIKADEEKILGELGDLFASVIGIAQFLHLDPEHAMRKCARKYRTRFEEAYLLATLEGQDFNTMNLDEKENYWKKAKKNKG
ncbi:MAG: nucleoside triphosphate pyrophosphohydrolase [Alphaproteobacteria bacterium]|nr:nucleoside triphosphate pyrophosphohydrolase [Alphaproteobacteria bacterium]